VEFVSRSIPTLDLAYLYLYRSTMIARITKKQSIDPRITPTNSVFRVLPFSTL